LLHAPHSFLFFWFFCLQKGVVFRACTPHVILKLSLQC
jgi:hypothetical protein